MLVRFAMTKKPEYARLNPRGAAARTAIASLALVLIGLVVWLSSPAPRHEASPATAAGQPAQTTVPMTQPMVGAPQPRVAPAPVPCGLGALVDDYNKAPPGSALESYLREVLKDSVTSISAGELFAQLDKERRPRVVEALAEALLARFNATDDPTIIPELSKRISLEKDPAVRAALLRSFRTTVEPSSKLLKEAGLPYESLVKDPSPEVRAAVVNNLAQDNRPARGRDPDVTNASVSVALHSSDPAVTERLLGNVQLAYANRKSVDDVFDRLGASAPETRAGAAAALGTVGTSDRDRAMKALAAKYRDERAPVVKKAILQALVRIGFQGARPILVSLKGLDPALDSEIDAWLGALALNRTLWTTLLREKRRLTGEAQQ